ncbi:MAG: VCBS repeat-containing protein, partial [Burkholderiales bacterium]|nr:VCBS repeat-containing protein [Burkholderiales bacterium]
MVANVTGQGAGVDLSTLGTAGAAAQANPLATQNNPTTPAGPVQIVDSSVAGQGQVASQLNVYSAQGVLAQDAIIPADTRFLAGSGGNTGNLLEIQHTVDGNAVATLWVPGTNGYTSAGTAILGAWQANTQYLQASMSGAASGGFVVVQDVGGQAVVTRWTTASGALASLDQTTLGAWNDDTRYAYGDFTGTGVADLMAFTFAHGVNSGSGTVTNWTAGPSGFAQGASINVTANGVPTQPLQYWTQNLNGTSKQYVVLALTDPAGNGDNLFSIGLNGSGTLTGTNSAWNGSSLGQPLSMVASNQGLSATGLVYQAGDGSRHLHIVTFNGNGAYAGALPDVTLGASATNETYLAGDINGDGLTDIVRISQNAQGQAVASIWYANTAGSGYTQAADQILGAWQAGAQYQLIDANQDGRVDLVKTLTDATGRTQITTLFGSSVGFVSNINYPADTQFIKGDLNGDGRTDLLEIQHLADGSALAVTWLASATG